MELLKKRWGLKTNWDVFVVFCLFTINGTLSTQITRPIFVYFGISTEMLSPWICYPLKFIIITIVYQSTFPLVGWLVGKFDFAWELEKKFLTRIGLGFLFKSKKIQLL